MFQGKPFEMASLVFFKVQKCNQAKWTKRFFSSDLAKLEKVDYRMKRNFCVFAFAQICLSGGQLQITLR
jgi:hypothetical protein